MFVPNPNSYGKISCSNSLVETTSDEFTCVPMYSTVLWMQSCVIWLAKLVKCGSICIIGETAPKSGLCAYIAHEFAVIPRRSRGIEWVEWV